MRAAAMTPSFPGEKIVSMTARAWREDNSAFLETYATSSVLFIRIHLLSWGMGATLRRALGGVKWIPGFGAAESDGRLNRAGRCRQSPGAREIPSRSKPPGAASR